MRQMHIAPLFEGQIDVIGDVHGEMGALRELLSQLGYNNEGVHPQGRRLVFVGDLGDRGPDSPAVVELVMGLVERQLAQCLLGNHELNLLRNESKAGNRWFVDPSHREQKEGGEFSQSKVASEWRKARYLEFFGSLPLALERKDLRVVHAAWVPDEIEALRHSSGTAVETFQKYEDLTLRQLEKEGLLDAGQAEESLWGARLDDRTAQVPLLPALGELDERFQMGNPVKVATSGVERLAKAPFWSSGKWRMCSRVRWWQEYQEDIPVVIGHYWRQVLPVRASPHASSKPEMFEDAGPTEWVGARSNVFCVDFSVGARYQERKAGRDKFETRLGALRWPEKQVWFETGRVSAVGVST